MGREVFINAINAIQKQVERDIKISMALSEAYPNAFQANLLPSNDIITDALVKVLKKEMDDNGDWINYYLWELNCGKENHRSIVKDGDGKVIPLSNANELYDMLANDIYRS